MTSEIDEHPKTPATRLISSYYTEALPLQNFLRRLVNGAILIEPEDEDAYQSLVKDSWVGLDHNFEERVFEVQQASESLTDVVNRAQRTIVQRALSQNIPLRSANIMTMGYSSTGPKIGGPRVDHPYIVNVFPNTNITFLKGGEVQLLLRRIGSEAMYHLLTNASIFMSLPNDCFVQITGKPIHAMEPIAVETTSKAESSCGVKRKRSQQKTADTDINPRREKETKKEKKTSLPAVELQLPRVRMFYAIPSFSGRKGKGATGLHGFHSKHPLNTSQFEAFRTALDDKARHLLKYIFPVEYKLVDSLNELAYTKSDKKRKDIELLIKDKGPQRTPKRLKQALILSKHLIQLHARCRYRTLLNVCCPSKLNQQQKDSSFDKSIILEMMSEVHTKSQLSVDISELTLSGTQPQGKTPPSKPKFAEFICTHREVYRYTAMITKFVIPKAWWGSVYNRRIILKAAREFIQCRRLETLTLHGVLQGFRTSDCDWLLPGNDAARNQRSTVTDYLKKRKLLEQFIFWYFGGFLIPLIRTNFYVTESGAYRNRVLYFRHDDWKTLCKPLVDRMKDATFQFLPEQNLDSLLQGRRLGFSHLRLLPKETGVRPIVNLSKKNIRGRRGYNASINQVLQGAFSVLSYEQTRHLELKQSAVFSLAEIHRNLIRFKNSLANERSSVVLPKLYFVKVDVKACFDTIEQGKLLGILKSLISEDRYMIQKYARVIPSIKNIRRSFPNKALAETERPHFIQQARTLAEALRHVIFIDQVFCSFEDREDLLKLLEEHITNNIVKVDGKLYRQVIGIPQGSVISTLLCSFFYGDLEARKMAFSDDPACLLMRFVDDYLMITTDLSKAKNFLRVMDEGHPEYGCFIEKAKTLTNFVMEDFKFGSSIPPGETKFPWCGNLINTLDLSVTTDLSRYRNIDIRDTLSVERSKKPAQSLVKKMLHLIKMRTHNIYADPALNSPKVLYLNVYHNMSMCALRMQRSLRSLHPGLSRNVMVLEKTITEVVNFNWSLLRKKWNARRHLKRSHVLWLGYHAFLAVIKARPTGFTELISKLEKDIRAYRNLESNRFLLGIVSEAMMTLEDVWR